MFHQELELLTFVASLVLSLTAWVAWYRDLASVNPLHGLGRQRFVLLVIPLLCLLLLAVVLKKLSAETVRTDRLYIAFYTFLGAGWLGGATLIFPFLGVSARDDALERSNTPALWTIAGGLLGISCSFAGANIGNGAGVEAVLFSAVLSSVLFLALWLGVDALTAILERITVERDEATGIRTAGLLIGVGLLSGWSVAGDWISASATLKDFARSAWPAILLSITATMVEHAFRRRTSKPSKVVPFIISATYVGVALAWVLDRGLK